MSTVTVEVVYRGIFQKNLGQRIGRGIVLAARKEGKVGISFGRYGDSPERNGIPAKQFAIVADDELELQISMARYEPTVVDITIGEIKALAPDVIIPMHCSGDNFARAVRETMPDKLIQPATGARLTFGT